MRESCTNKQMIPIIPVNKRNTKDKKKLEAQELKSPQKEIFKRRIRIENFFGILKQYKRIDKINEKYIETYKSFLYLALADILMKRMGKK